MKLNLTPERRKWATAVWETALAAKETTAETLKDYLESIAQPFFDERINAITDSWRPVDAPEVAAKRGSVAELVKELPADKLAEIEAAIIAASEDK